MSQSTATKQTKQNPDEKELTDCTFVHSVRLKRSTAHLIWNESIEMRTRMFLDFGGIPKLVLRDSESLEAIRYIPWHCVKDFTLKG